MSRGLYTPVYVSLPRHKKVLRLAARLGINRHSAIGLVVDLWAWAMTNSDKTGNLGDVNGEEIAAAVDWRGSSDELVTSLHDAGFLDGSSGAWMIHEWEEYGGKVMTRLEKERARGKENRQLPPQIPQEYSKNTSIIPQELHADETRRDNTRIDNSGVAGEPPPEPPPAVGPVRVNYSPAFEEFWQASPRTGSKANAYKTWQRFRCATIKGEIIAAVTAHRQTEQWRKGYIPHMVKWLNGRHWEDEIDAINADGLSYEERQFREFDEAHRRKVQREREGA